VKTTTQFVTFMTLVPLMLLSMNAAGDSLSLRFLGTGPAISLDDALAISDVDLAEDTNLTDDEIEALEINIAACWAVPMVDPASEIPLGTGIDCLYPFDVSDDPGPGISLQALSFFSFDSGTIVTIGLTSVRPFRIGVGDAGGDVTHMTGSIPADRTGVVGGTGAYAGKEGSARVSGAASLVDFPDFLTFDCLWLIEVEDIPPGLTRFDNDSTVPPGVGR